jgi:hypothetical protein
MFHKCYLYLFTYAGVQHYFHIRWFLCHLTATRWASHVEQELVFLTEHVGSPVFSGVCIAQSFVFCVMFNSSFVLFLLSLYCLFFYLCIVCLWLLIVPFLNSLNTKKKLRRCGRDCMVVWYVQTFLILFDVVFTIYLLIIKCYLWC